MLSKKCLFGRNGYTIIELLIVITVIGGLAGLFLTTYPASQRRARDTKRRSDIKQYQAAIEVYAGSHNNLYFVPTSSDIKDSCTTLNLTGTKCVDDATNHYQIAATTTSYVVWAQLEQEDDSGNTVYFIACSNGLTGESTTAPSSATCPASF
jgi:prepilin-type N-terminal cleavage/methylation domain-containing protein